MGILLAVLLYEVITIGGVAWYLSRKEKPLEGDEFIDTGRKLSPMLAGITTALTILGAVHIFGIMEMTWDIGAIAVWWGIATVVTICVICLATGRWVRRMRVVTIPELLDRLFGKKIRIACTCIIAVQTFAILTMETQALGIILHTLTKGAVGIPVGAALGATVGLAYVLLAGMKEVAWVNVFNAAAMYISLILAVLYLGDVIPGGWNAVGDYYDKEGQAHMYSLLGDKNMLWTFGLSLVVASVFCQGISQMGLHTSLSAKSERAVVKSLWWAAPLNGMFGIFMVAIGLAAKSLYMQGDLVVSAETAAKTAGIFMLLKYLPDWLLTFLVAGFMGAVLSTFAMTTLGLGAMFTKDLYCNLHRPNASPEVQTRLTRVIIILSVVVAAIVASFLPPIGAGAAWIMAWLCPIFFNVLFGLFWKRSRLAAGTTFAATWLVLLLWSFTPLPVQMGIQDMATSYVSLFVCVVVGVVANGILPGEAAYFRDGANTEAGAVPARNAN